MQLIFTIKNATSSDVEFFKSEMIKLGCVEVLPFGNHEEFSKDEIIFYCTSEEIKEKILLVKLVSSGKIKLLRYEP